MKLQKKTSIRLFLLVAISTIVTIFSIIVILIIVENYFFDRLLYKKSTLHGYTSNEWNAHKSQNDFFIEKRIKDIRRLRESSQIENDDSFKIAVIGDSISYGLGVRNSQSFPLVLEKKLNKIRKTDVLNLSLSGDSILENYVKFVLINNSEEIDLFIFTLVANDLIFADSDKYPHERKVFSQLTSICTDPVYRYQYEKNPNATSEEITVVHYESFSDDYSNICILNEIAKSIISPKTLFFPLERISLAERISDGWPDHHRQLTLLMKKYINILQNNGGHVLIPAEEIVVGTVSDKEDHPSKTSHLVFAEMLYNEILTNTEYGFTR